MTKTTQIEQTGIPYSPYSNHGF